jgi:hypothetical protein
MGRRIVTGTFWFWVLLWVAPLLAVGMRALWASDPVPNVLGAWDGFFQVDGSNDTPGLVVSDITQQAHRRISGNGVLLAPEGDVQLNAYNFSATVTGNDFITGTGRAPTGQLVFQADLETFPGVEGDAGVLHPQFHFVPARGQASRVSSTLLHPFPDAHAPDIAGFGMGRIQSDIDPNFRGGLAVQIYPRDRGAFPGQIVFMPESDMHPTWQLRATTSDAGHFVMIAQGKTGKLVANGAAFPAEGGGSSTSVWGLYRLLRTDGRLDFGAYNFNVAPPIQ